MDEKRIEQVLEIENRAQAIRDAALKEAEQLPIQAEKESQVNLEKLRSQAQQEAHQIVENARGEEELKRISDQAKQEAHQIEATAMTNLDRAVSYVINRTIGRE